MFTAPLLVAGLLTLGPQPQPPPAFPSLTAQAQARAHSIVLTQDTQTTAEPAKSRDPLWDGPAKGAFLGGLAGLVGGVVGYGKGGGEWPEQGGFLMATTVFGAAVGAATGLVVDLIRR